MDMKDLKEIPLYFPINILKRAVGWLENFFLFKKKNMIFKQIIEFQAQEFEVKRSPNYIDNLYWTEFL